MQSALIECLEGEWACDASFSFGKVYNSAPNPALQVDALGVIGLPLSDRDADALKVHAQKVISGTGPGADAEKSDECAWEIDASLVSSLVLIYSLTPVQSILGCRLNATMRNGRFFSQESSTMCAMR